MHLHLLHRALLRLSLESVELKLLVEVRRNDVRRVSHEVCTVVRQVIHGAVRCLVA